MSDQIIKLILKKKACALDIGAFDVYYAHHVTPSKGRVYEKSEVEHNIGR